MLCCVLFSGLLHSILLMGYVVITLAGPLHKTPEIDLSPAVTEGSGQGHMFARTDDEDMSDLDYNNAVWSYYDAEYGAGADDDDGGGGGRSNGEDSEAELGREDSLKITCFHCHGDGINGCDVEMMLRDVQTYSMRCFGKCLNLSSGSLAVYDCAYDMVTKTDTCLRNGDTQMCFCSQDFCNKPSENDTLHLSQGSPFPRQQQSPPLFNATSNDHLNPNVNLDNKSGNSFKEIRKEAKTDRFGRKYYRNKSTVPEGKMRLQESRGEHTIEIPIQHSEISTDQRSAVVSLDHKTQIDFVISHPVRSLGGNSTSMDLALPNAIRLRVDTLRSRGDMNPANNCSVALSMPYSAFMLIFLLLVQCGL